MEIGKKIRELRMWKGLTQEELAERIDRSTQFISTIERGLAGPSLETVIHLIQNGTYSTEIAVFAPWIPLYGVYGILILLLTLVLHVFGRSIINLMRQGDNPVVIFFTDLIDLRFFLLLFLQSLVFTLMFMALPNKRNHFMESLPGGVLSSLGWLVFSDIYSIYVENFSKYSTIYGSVYAIAITMLWLYCCMSILFYGGALNRYLMDK